MAEEKKETIIDKKEIQKNLKESKKKTMLIYIIPLIALIIVAVIYIPTHQNWLLIPFALLMFVVLFGHDGASRTCPNCKKWNSVIYTESKNFTRTTTEETTNSKGKKKTKQTKEKLKKYIGKCQNCGHEVTTEKKRYF